MMRAYQFDQIKLISAITAEMARQHPGVPADNRANVVMQAANLICAEYEREPVAAEASMGLAAWLQSDDVGMSSQYMAWVLSDGDKDIWGSRTHMENYHPHDVGDFGRCVRMIDAVPEFASRIHLMAAQGHEWAAVAGNWVRWSEIYQYRDYECLRHMMKEAYSAKAGE